MEKYVLADNGYAECTRSFQQLSSGFKCVKSSDACTIILLKVNMKKACIELRAVIKKISLQKIFKMSRIKPNATSASNVLQN